MAVERAVLAAINERLKRGNHETPGPEVPPGVLSVLCSADTDSVLKSKISSFTIYNFAIF